MEEEEIDVSNLGGASTTRFDSCLQTKMDKRRTSLADSDDDEDMDAVQDESIAFAETAFT